MLVHLKIKPISSITTYHHVSCFKSYFKKKIIYLTYMFYKNLLDSDSDNNDKKC